MSDTTPNEVAPNVIPDVNINGEPQVSEKVEQRAEVTQAQPQYTEAEQRAMSKGWRPKDQFEGDPDEWRPAREWLERGELFERMRHISKEANEAKQALNGVYGEFVKYRQNAYQQALQALKADRREAMQEGDFEKVEKIEEQIDTAKQAAAAEAQKLRQQTQANKEALTPAYQEFVAANPWYTTDTELRDAADAVAMNFMREKNGQYDEFELTDFVSKRVRKLFPDKFKRPSGPPSPDSSGSRQSGNTTTQVRQSSGLESRMSSEEQKIMQTLIKSGVVTKEQYMKDYEAIQRS